jgi:hypothetical protein
VRHAADAVGRRILRGVERRIYQHVIHRSERKSGGGEG